MEMEKIRNMYMDEVTATVERTVLDMDLGTDWTFGVEQGLDVAMAMGQDGIGDGAGIFCGSGRGDSDGSGHGYGIWDGSGDSDGCK